MTPEDEEIMLDNFVTFFIAGETAGLDYVWKSANHTKEGAVL